MTVAIASYLPESMIIKIGPTLRLLDDQGKPVALPTAEVFGFFSTNTRTTFTTFRPRAASQSFLTLWNSGVAFASRTIRLAIAAAPALNPPMTRSS